MTSLLVYFMLLLKKIIPSFLIEGIIRIKEKYNIRKSQYYQKFALKELKNKRTIKCVFLALFEEIWKYDNVYRLMTANPRFEALIMVCPIVNYGKENMIKRMNACYDALKNKGYNVIRAYNEEFNSYIDLKKDLSPDIIFYTSPYKGLIDERYYITKFKKKLTVYVPYFMNSNKDYKMSCNLELHNLVWRRYSETEYHRLLSVRYAKNKGINVVNTGYPGIEPFLHLKNHNTKTTRKRIIWAPHHTIEPVGIIFYSCFLKYYDFFLEMAEKYKKEVHFVFKPHPLLRNKLYGLWGKERTDAYYHLWEQSENMSLNEGDYVDLFTESDAMIHDSASFIVEYLYLNKPVMRTLNGEGLEIMYNTFGLQCIHQHYLASTEQDVEQFIRNVICGVDPMKEQRSRFINESLMPKGSPSQNIIDDILDSIDNQILYRN